MRGIVASAIAWEHRLRAEARTPFVFPAYVPNHVRLADLDLVDRPPSVVAERLPKALIHHNVDGEPVHALLRDLDTAWERAAGHGGFGVRQRFLATVDDVRGRWPVEPGPSRWRLGEITLPWTAVAPAPTG